MLSFSQEISSSSSSPSSPSPPPPARLQVFLASRLLHGVQIMPEIKDTSPKQSAPTRQRGPWRTLLQPQERNPALMATVMGPNRGFRLLISFYTSGSPSLHPISEQRGRFSKTPQPLLSLPWVIKDAPKPSSLFPLLKMQSHRCCSVSPQTEIIDQLI